MQPRVQGGCPIAMPACQPSGSLPIAAAAAAACHQLHRVERPCPRPAGRTLFRTTPHTSHVQLRRGGGAVRGGGLDLWPQRAAPRRPPSRCGSVHLTVQRSFRSIKPRLHAGVAWLPSASYWRRCLQLCSAASNRLQLRAACGLLLSARAPLSATPDAWSAFGEAVVVVFPAPPAQPCAPSVRLPATPGGPLALQAPQPSCVGPSRQPYPPRFVICVFKRDSRDPLQAWQASHLTCPALAPQPSNDC